MLKFTNFAGMNKYPGGTRPSSSELIDLHVSIVPLDHWIPRLNHTSQNVIDETFSVGFIRVHPDNNILSLRKDISEQIGDQIFPSKYVFLKYAGRCLVLVREQQEYLLKAKNFLTPGSILPEIFILPSQPSTYNHLTLPPTKFPSLTSGVGSNPTAEEPNSFPTNPETKENDRSNHDDVNKCPVIQPQITKRVNDKERDIPRKDQHISKRADGENNVASHQGEPESRNISKNRKAKKTDISKDAESNKGRVKKRLEKKTQKSEIPERSHRRLPPSKESINRDLPPSTSFLGQKDRDHLGDAESWADSAKLPIKEEPIPSANASLKSKSRDLKSISNVDSGYTDDSLEKDGVYQNKDNLISPEKRSLSKLPNSENNDIGIIFPQRKSIDEPPITIPSFAKSATKIEKMIKLPAGKENPPTMKSKSSTDKRKGNNSPRRQQMWNDLQKSKDERLTSQKKLQILAKKTTKVKENLPTFKNVTEKPIKKKKPTTLFQTDLNNPGEKCPACYYVFSTQADRKRHLALIHNIRISKVTLEDKDSKSWRAKVILKVSQERMNYAGMINQTPEKHKGDGRVVESMVKPINFYDASKRRRTRSGTSPNIKPH